MAEGTRSSKMSIKSTLSQAVKTLIAKMKTLYKKESTTPKAMVHPADKTCHNPPSQAVETLTANKTDTLCNEKSTTQGDMTNGPGYSVVTAATIEFDKDKVLTYKDLQFLSNNFSPDNYMGRTHFGHLYKGIIPEDWKGKRSGEVTIKMWKNEQFLHEDCIIPHHPVHIKHRMAQEIDFLQQPDIAMHPYTVNVTGYCLEDNNLGVVYDLKPLRTLKMCIHDDNFGWFKRVNVAVKLAYLLKFFHEHVPEYIVRNLSPAHVMIDQDLNPILIDYAMIHGGSFVEPLPMEHGGPYGSHGYISNNEIMIGETTKRNDVHGYGVILLEMMRKITFYNNRESELKGSWTDEFAWNDYVRHKVKQEEESGGSGPEDYSYSFAHESLRNDPDYDARDGNKISILGLRCVEKLRPRIRSMGQLLEELKELNVVQCHPELLLDDEDY